MAVRYDQATHINEGLANEEQKYNIKREWDSDNNEFLCDLPLLDESHAADAFNTMTAASVWAWLTDGVGVNWVEHHTCDHDQDERDGCKKQSYKEYGEPLGV